MDYESIREEAKSTGCRVEELLALTKANDPFYSEMPFRVRDGTWFAGIWRMLGEPTGAHLRRLHYQLVSQHPPVEMADGSAYQNTEVCWQALNTASRNARYLGLISPTALEDHRSPRPLLYATARETPEPRWELDKPLFWLSPPRLPTLDLAIEHDLAVDLAPPEPVVWGYDYEQADQPYHLEIWIEKSTMTDVLLPVCRELGVDLVVGVGYLSVTRVVEMIRRVADQGKPARIFYLSDHDPSGENMPVQVARQVEFWLPEIAGAAEIMLQPLVLTAEQAARYALPRTPIKASHTAKDGFEARHGAGAVELDALEALHPGELARLVREAIAPYVDEDLAERLGDAESEADDAITTAWNEATEAARAELDAIAAEAEAIIAPYREQVREIAARLEAAIAPLNVRVEGVWHAMQDKTQALEVQLPERPEPESEPPDDEWDWLFDSSRGYDDQLAYYKERRPGSAVSARRLVSCTICGTRFYTVQANAKTCKQECRDELERRRSREKHAAKRTVLLPRPCDVCGTTFTPIKVTGRFCKKRCKEIAQIAARKAARNAAS